MGVVVFMVTVMVVAVSNRAGVGSGVLFRLDLRIKVNKCAPVCGKSLPSFGIWIPSNGPSLNPYSGNDENQLLILLSLGT